MIEARALRRFLLYSSIGLGTFLLDLALLFLLTDWLQVDYLVAAGIAFVLAVSLNYVLSRRFVFVGTTRAHQSAYANFLGIAGVGLIFVTFGMYVLVSVFGAYYVYARVIVAAVTGVWNYLMNLYINFKVAGVYNER
ncbi:MAG: hypothetical protein RL538_39 [Candidatus Parcubacteria bacterium]|jgi:putative flippase GtrA